MKLTISLTIQEPLYKELLSHLFPGDGDEHGAVIAAGLVTTPQGIRFLARDLFLAKDGVDYIPGEYGYRALSASFVAKVSDYCAREKLCYLAVHSHGGSDSVEFSGVDLASHERGYPALLDITNGGPVGALVFAESAVAGDIWTPSGRYSLDYLTIIGSKVRKLYPGPVNRPYFIDLMYDRHARLFGEAGQAVLGNLKVGVIGLGGGGSLLNEWLSRLGVGHIIAIDFDKVELTNLPRIVGATEWDAMAIFARSRLKWFRQLGKIFSQYKVHVAKRVARQANPKVRYEAFVGNIRDEETALKLRDADFIFLATDNMESRNIFNSLTQQYLIPGCQVGAKVSVNPKTKEVEIIHTATRPVVSYPEGGCLYCQGAISPVRLTDELKSEEERKNQRYVDEETVTQPSVVTLNVQSAVQGANDFLFMFTGLYNDDVELKSQLAFLKSREPGFIDSTASPTCIECGNSSRSRKARGDRRRLPCRQTSKK